MSLFRERFRGEVGVRFSVTILRVGQNKELIQTLGFTD